MSSVAPALQNDGPQNIIIKPSSRRWFVLITFASISLMNAFHWIEHNIIQDVIVNFYNQSLPGGTISQNEAVNWLSMVYMLCYIPLVFPAMFLLDLKGLKLSVILGALLTTIGAWIKCASVNPKHFAVLMFGQTICAIAQVFTLGVPARLSSLWFGESQISTATSIGVFGNQLGTAIGFIIPPFVVPNDLSIVQMKTRFYYLYFSVAGICTILLVFAFFGIRINNFNFNSYNFISNFILVIKNKPEMSPNHGQIVVNSELSKGFRLFLNSLANLFKNRNFILLLISYGKFLVFISINRTENINFHTFRYQHWFVLFNFNFIKSNNIILL
jgi:FLVCR family feline leukemia virus subgroup C receptor-related protein